MSVAFIFPGQGAQVTGMGRDFYEQTDTGRKVFDKASQLLGFSMPELCFEPNERLNLTEYTQAAMVTVSIAMMKVLMEETKIRPDVAAGLSLGEYCALFATGAMSEEDAITAVRKRGILMQQAVPAGIGSMAAILGMEAAGIEAVLADLKEVQIANYNCPGQIVISGKKEAVELAGEKLKGAGAKRVIPLNVSGPFHSCMLSEAGKELGKALEGVELHPLKIPYVANVTADYVTDRNEIKGLLEKQVSHSVRWQNECRDHAQSWCGHFYRDWPGEDIKRIYEEN